MAIERDPIGTEMEPPQNAAEMRLVFNVLRAVVNSIGPVIGPDIELVAHDLSRPEASILAIANGHISGREVGGPVIGGPKGDAGFKLLIEEGGARPAVSVISDYKTTVAGGRELDSLSVLFRAADGSGLAGLCVNADRARMRALRDLLDGFLDTPGQVGPRAARGEAQAGPGSVEEMAARIIEESIASVAQDPANLTREERMRAVQAMQDRGLFLIRQSADLAAERLGVTRYTIYNYLDLKSRRES